MYKKTILKNGLRIITVPQKNTEAVTVLVLVGTGSKYETKEISGISHFLEHMFFKGTSKRPDKLEIAETLDRVGGIYNAFTGEDYTGYFAKVAARHFDLALDWVSDIFLNSLLPEKEINTEKGVIIEEINMTHDNPMSQIGLLWNELLYGDQPAGWDIAGTKETVGSINQERLLGYMKSQYVASSTIICLAGRIEETKATKKVIEYFSGMRTNGFAKKLKVVERQKNPNCLLHTKETDQTHLCLGARGFNIFHPQKYAQEILAVILGGMMSSRLFVEVRDKLGLAYYIRTESEQNPDTGFLVTQAGIDSKNIEKAIQTIVAGYRKISQLKIPQKELKKAKDCITGKTTLVLESSDARASFYSMQELFKNEILTPDEIYAKINKVSADEVRKTARIIFSPANLNLAILGPFKDKARFEKLLKM